MKISVLGMINALGSSKIEILKNACSGNQFGIKMVGAIHGKRVYLGTVSEKLPHIEDSAYNFRTNQLLLHCFNQIEDEWTNLTSKYSSSRIGVVLGSNNTGLEKLSLFSSNDFANIKWIEEGTPAEFLQKIGKIGGVTYTVSTACSSGAKIFATARNLICNDVCDAVLLGGANDLHPIMIGGFDALGAYSKKITNPFSKNRDGINIGEGAVLLVVEKGEGGIEVLGVGESSDAYQSTAPDLSGAGAKAAMRAALRESKLLLKDISYINLHGTGTMQNDLMEGAAVLETFGHGVVCASTKPLTGHLLGTAGATEIALCWLMMSDLNEDSLLIPHIYDGEDMENPLIFAKPNQRQMVKYCLSNSFAFYGSNASVIIGKKYV
jgi:3-oxoacyl-[acyl-carrier-protein] synthase-1